MFKMYVNITLTPAPYVPDTLLLTFCDYSAACNALIFPNVTVLTLPAFVAFVEGRKFLSSQFCNFSNFLLRSPTWTQILSSGPYPQTPLFPALHLIYHQSL